MIEEVLDPQEVKEAPQVWRFIGAEVSEQLDYEPAKFLRRRLIRNKYVSRKDGDLAPLIAELPPSLQERCIAALDCWRQSWWESIAIIFLSIGRKAFSKTVME